VIECIGQVFNTDEAAFLRVMWLLATKTGAGDLRRHPIPTVTIFMDGFRWGPLLQRKHGKSRFDGTRGSDRLFTQL
jgi:hypothetical protein